ncbi:MAG TPA: flagellar motor protein MotB [Marinilabiliales bacterium]|nr:flagellar motor protein MotB [Marinilabiliales bacterium]HAZ01888.1 flagellar motor protein MotB [Marinilabiliales bacterium]HBO73975.1 flagellar motor protein MotB [Marinilabiliales bacterium]HBX86668.1 flagellar motor protein MotB [Marinilabiliales bacterium]HBY53726.1 flagellar motor protein MotB [Marinilabiliales bacterium]
MRRIFYNYTIIKKLYMPTFRLLVLAITFYGSLHYLDAQPNYATRSKKAIEYYEEAGKAYQQMLYEKAVEYLNRAIEKDAKFVDAYLLMAEVYRSQDSTHREIDCYLKAIDIDAGYFPYVHFNLATAYWKVGKYRECESRLNVFLTSDKAKPITMAKAKDLLKKCQFAQTLIDEPVPFKPLNLGPAINDQKDQYWPSLSVDGQTLVYTVMLVDSTRKTLIGTYAHQEDFYISHWAGEQWQKGLPLGPPINTPGNEGAQQISADGKTLVFTGCNRPDGFGNCDIYFSHFIDGQWAVPENAGPLLNSSFSEKQPVLSADGRILYFASDRPGSIGGMDIWASKLSLDGQWLRPVNLGRVVNTVFDEASPFIHADNRSFYFSSEGHPGLGKKDIFYSFRNDSNSWSKPANIGFPINTYRDEIGLVIDYSGTKAYYSSDVLENNWNIFQFELPEKVKPNPVAYALGTVTDGETHQVLQAEVLLLSLTNGDTVARVFSGKEDGTFLVCLPAGASYALTVSHTEYLFCSMNFNLELVHSIAKPYQLNIELFKPKVGESVVLENIFFETDSYILLPQSETELQKLIEFVNQNPKLQFEIGGHTDDTGTSEYNLELSNKRAKSVLDYLLMHTNSTNRLTFKGYGKTVPVLPNTTDENRAKNRRTELKVVGQL